MTPEIAAKTEVRRPLPRTAAADPTTQACRVRTPSLLPHF